MWIHVYIQYLCLLVKMVSRFALAMQLSVIDVIGTYQCMGLSVDVYMVVTLYYRLIPVQ